MSGEAMNREQRRQGPRGPRQLRCMVCQYKVKPGPNAVIWKNQPAHQTCLDTLLMRAQERQSREG